MGTTSSSQAMLQVKTTEGMLFHSDQGSVYGEKSFVSLVTAYGLTQSMSRCGNCWDNAPVERWFRSFKSEWLPKGGYPNIKVARRDIAQYVLYYNNIRPHQYYQGLQQNSPAITVGLLTSTIPKGDRETQTI